MKALFTLLFIFSFNCIFSQDKLTLDSTFGTMGRTVLSNPFGSGNFYPQAQQVFLQDGSIVQLVSNLNPKDSFSYYMKTKADGSQDLTFGKNGFFKIKMITNYFDVFALKSLKSSFLLFGINDTIGFIMKLKNNGTFDSTFAVNGHLKDSYRGLYYNSYVINDSNYIFQHLNLEIYEYSIKKINYKGVSDVDFSSNLYNTLSKYAKYDVDKLLVQNENEILIKFANDTIIKINGKGQQVPNFFFNGIVSDTINILGLEFVEPDTSKQILIYGNYTTSTDTNNNYFLAKLKSDGTLDKTFNGKGFINLPSINKRYGILSNRNYCNWYKINKYIYFVTEETFNTTAKRERVITRFNLNGTLDTTFYNKGRWVVDTLESTSVTSNIMRPLMNSNQFKNKLYLYGKDGNNYTFKMFKVTNAPDTVAKPNKPDTLHSSIHVIQNQTTNSIFPNPIVGNEFNLNINGDFSELEIAIFNLEGKKVFDFNKTNMIIQNKSVKLFLPSSFETGFYILKGRTKTQSFSNQIEVY